MRTHEFLMRTREEKIPRDFFFCKGRARHGLVNTNRTTGSSEG